MIFSKNGDSGSLYYTIKDNNLVPLAIHVSGNDEDMSYGVRIDVVFRTARDNKKYINFCDINCYRKYLY